VEEAEGVEVPQCELDIFRTLVGLPISGAREGVGESLR
jgi:hypothetical protein